MAVATPRAAARRARPPRAEGEAPRGRGVAPEPAAVQLKSVEDLSDKSWRVLRATPLYRLSTDGVAPRLQQGAGGEDARDGAQGHAVVVGDAEQGELRRRVGVVANVASTARDADALGILIRRQQGSAGADDEEDNEEFLGYPIDGSGLMVGMSKQSRRPRARSSSRASSAPSATTSRSGRRARSRRCPSSSRRARRRSRSR